MYLIIVEGTDNIGKDTLINRLLEQFQTITLIHCGAPNAKCFQPYFQDNTFITYANNIKNGIYDGTDCIIMNRSHYGEYVYGQIYRDRKPQKIKNMILAVDAILKSRNDLTVKYIQLMSTSIQLRKSNDDQKSLSDMDTKKMKLENELFDEIFNISQFDKKIVYVNNENEFRSKDDIYNEVINFLNE